MTYPWSRSVFPIAAIFAFRMLGLFMLIPIFSVLGTSLEGATPTLIGIALGAYGLTQGLLQIPFGMLSDRVGRKPVLLIGLTLFAIGSLVGVVTHSIYGMILARTLQGTGAIGSVLIALLADLTPEKKRAQAMAVVGASIGLSFSIAMIASPIVAEYLGLAGIFQLTVLLALCGLCLVYFVIPTPQALLPGNNHRSTKPALFKPILRDVNLQRLNFSIFTQHLILTSTFFAIPLLLKQHLEQGYLQYSWHFYLPLMFFAFVMMLPILILSEKKQQTKACFIGAVGLTGFSQLLLVWVYPHWSSFCVLMLTYFMAFNLLEASIPALVSKQASAEAKGTAMGVYSSCQFLGIFVGGTSAGFIYAHLGSAGLFGFNGILGLIWLAISLKLNPPPLASRAPNP